jgi:GAF domain-containing protein
LHTAVTATRAAAGLLHRLREPFIGLVTSSAHGPAGIEAELGQVIPRHDPALAAAQARKPVLGAKNADLAERAIARRFSACGSKLAAVAMVPVFDGDTLLAMLELGRTDHAFRSTDAEVLKTIAELVSSP